MNINFFIKDPQQRVRSLIKKLTHSGETELDKEHLLELKKICKASGDDVLIIVVFKECIKYLRKEHSQVRVSTVKLIDYLFQKSHIIRENLLDEFDIFLELTLAVSRKADVKLKLPPPKKYANLLQELTAKLIHTWHAEYGQGYEKLRYAYRFLREHQLVDFSHFQVRTHEDLIKRQKLAEQQEKILTRSIDNRLKEFQELKPEIEQILAQIESLLDILIPDSNLQNEDNPEAQNSTLMKEQFGISNISQNIDIEFSPYVEVTRNPENKETVENLRELKRELLQGKLTKLISIEKTISKRSEQFIGKLREMIDLKTKAMNLVMKLSDLEITNNAEDGTPSKGVSTIDRAGSDSDNDSDFEDVEPKEDVETYIPKSMRFEYGLEAIDPRELESVNRVSLTDDSFSLESQPSTSGLHVMRSCNFLLDSGKLCPRRDKVKCPFHGKIIPRDHKGIPIDEEDRAREERKSSTHLKVPDWQDPDLLRDLQAATGVDLRMPEKGKTRATTKKRLADTRTCDLTPKQRLEKRLRMLTR